MSYEVHFYLSCFVNKQIFRYWSDVNSRLLHKTPFHSQNVTVWCAVSANEIIGPFFFESEAENAVPLILSDTLQWFVTSLNYNLPIFQWMKIRFFNETGQQATLHEFRWMLWMLRFRPRHFTERGYPMAPSLFRYNAFRFFIWGYLKSKLFEDNPPKNIQAFKQRIRDGIEAIFVIMLREVMENFQFRLQECIHFNGGHLANVVYT